MAKRKKRKTKSASTKKTNSAGKLKVGILTSPDEEKYFSNGLHQNAYNLVTLFNKSEILEPVLLYPENMYGGDAKVKKIWGQKVYPLGSKGIEMNVILEVSFGPQASKWLRSIMVTSLYASLKTLPFQHLLTPAQAEPFCSEV